MTTSRRSVLLKSETGEPTSARNRLSGKGFAAEHVKIEQSSSFSYRWSGSAHYLALHDIRLADGETFVNGKLASRLRDLTNRITFIPSGCVVGGWSVPRKQSNSFTALYFHPNEMSDELMEHYGSADLFPQVYFEDPALLATLQKVSGLLMQHGTHHRLYAESLGLTAVLELLRLQKNPLKEASVRKGGLSLRQQTILRDYIEDYLHTDISLSDLASLVGLTRFYFTRIFAVTFGEPPHRYVSRRRVEYAKQLLQDTDMAIAEIADRVGLKSATLLSRHMRKFVGFAPREFRRREP